ncbi:MAG: TetR/AcrR family transcriptional regulator [Deltaproteobacteria bacterium]|nr:TetR/AcrR family transcriptional regulator [Deltaproteobacteria bacterium]MBW2047023.1 TetR/AcrR family transcriptional regulator [Deltaproteobacteria bacterium]MBW2112585.1 TetR/AcrR family transcriptional regulator [Deltaproteobacteria bacterium]MBW2351667.1 TetR/AcrR family transcriptional regulator [Deltaproteobacteria bacterium]
MELKQRIIAESLKLFSLKGFLSTSIQDIMETAHTSKGGLYNHFSSKEELLSEVLGEARKIWRENNLAGLDQVEHPLEKLKMLLRNYRDRYLKDKAKLPGGCIFVTLSVELDDQRPHLIREINRGFAGLKGMINEFLDQGKKAGDLRDDVDTKEVTEMIFSVILGAAVIYGLERGSSGADNSINAVIRYIDRLSV